MKLIYRYSKDKPEFDDAEAFKEAISNFPTEQSNITFDNVCKIKQNSGGGIFSAKTIRRLRRKSSYSGSTRCLKRRKLRNGKTRVHLTKRRHLQK